jgi:hypothetical protein
MSAMRCGLVISCAALICTGVCSGARAAEPEDFLPPIAIIDFHGLRGHSEDDVRKVLPFKEGDRVALKPGYDDGSAIARALNVAQANLSFVCCTPEEQFMVFVGIAEAAPPSWPAPPGGAARLPMSIIQADEEFKSLFFQLLKSGGLAPSDHSQGHDLAPHPPLRALQDGFVSFARENRALIQQVLTESADEKHRAVAAMLAGYLPDKAIAAKLLAQASSDPDASVRNNSTRALAIIAEYALVHPELGIHIDAGPFIDMLNSPTWTDLNKGIFVLSVLTVPRDPALLAQLRQRALPALIDICRWKSAGHAEPGCAVLRRVEGLPERSGPEGRAEVLTRLEAN